MNRNRAYDTLHAIDVDREAIEQELGGASFTTREVAPDDYHDGRVLIEVDGEAVYVASMSSTDADARLNLDDEVPLSALPDDALAAMLEDVAHYADGSPEDGPREVPVEFAEFAAEVNTELARRRGERTHTPSRGVIEAEAAGTIEVVFGVKGGTQVRSKRFDTRALADEWAHRWRRSNATGDYWAIVKDGADGAARGTR